MLPTHRIPVHPGEVLLEEFLNPLGLTQVAFAQHIGVPLQRINEIVRGKRGTTSATAWLFSNLRRRARTRSRSESEKLGFVEKHSPL